MTNRHPMYSEWHRDQKFFGPARFDCAKRLACYEGGRGRRSLGIADDDMVGYNLSDYWGI